MESQLLMNEIKKKGYLLKDNLLPYERFSQYRKQVHDSFSNKLNWETCFKADERCLSIPMQNASETKKIKNLIKQKRKSGCFQYLFHSLISKNDTDNIITPILKDVLKMWKRELEILKPDAVRERFSLTAFTKGCFLDAHNDYTSDKTPYEVTILFYFGANEDIQSEGGLIFNYNSPVHIAPIGNRSILFIPTKQTEHWVEPPKSESVRFALSGWLLK